LLNDLKNFLDEGAIHGDPAGEWASGNGVGQAGQGVRVLLPLGLSEMKRLQLYQ
jgi:hypothetical protein